MRTPIPIYSATEFTQQHADEIAQNKPIISYDFDDVIFPRGTHITGNRAEMFSMMSRCLPVSSVIVTGRRHRDHIDEIAEYCDKIGFRANGIVFGTAEKEKILRFFNPLLVHFEDDVEICQRLTEAGIPSCLMGEFSSRQFVEKIWLPEVKAQGVASFYQSAKDCSEEDLVRIKTIQSAEIPVFAR